VLRSSYDLGLIIPTREEFDCAREILSFASPVSDGGYYLHPFTVPGSDATGGDATGSDVTGIAVVLFDLGLAGTAIAATTLLDRFEIKMLALIGIAGALDSSVSTGDVVIASSIDEYLHAAKATADGPVDEFEVGGNSWTASRDIVNFANNFRYLSGSFDAWRQRVQARHPLDLPVRGGPDYLVGRIASGDVYGAARQFAQWLLSHNRQRVALEMESAGAAQAIYRSGRDDLLVIRGISNAADGHQRGQSPQPGWRRYAALNAVDLLSVMVTNASFPWRTPRVSPAKPTPPGDSTGHVFLSYAPEDSAAVDRLQSALESASIKVWRDTNDLLPGQDLRSAIRTAITGSAFVFIACFSTASLARTKSRQNEELTLAIEEARQRSIDQPWLIPVRLDDCEIPDRGLGGGRTLRSLVSIDLFGPKQADQTQRLVKSVLMILGRS
jgi:nucleoside phosphorylase